MKITKTASVSAKNSKFDEATKHVRAAIDCLCKVPNTNVIACDSIANLSVVLFDLQGASNKVTAATETAEVHTTTVSVDFTYAKSYDERLLESEITDALEALGEAVVGIDFHEVDYSSYPEYKDSNVSQCNITFEWKGNYNDAQMLDKLTSIFESASCEVIGSDFYSADE